MQSFELTEKVFGTLLSIAKSFKIVNLNYIYTNSRFKLNFSQPTKIYPSHLIKFIIERPIKFSETIDSGRVNVRMISAFRLP